MSQENVEIVRRGWQAYERGDLDVALAYLSPDVVTHLPAPVGGIYHGPDGALQSLLDWAEGFDELVIAPQEYIDAGDQVVVRTRQRGRGADSGVPVEGEFWYVYTLRAGKTVRIDILQTRREALEAAGLSE